MTKTDIRNMEVLKVGGSTYAQIGQMYGVSRQRIQQLLRPPASVRRILWNEAACSQCGKPLTRKPDLHHNGGGVEHFNDRASIIPLCLSCHRRAHPNKHREYRTCRNCGIAYYNNFRGVGTGHGKSFCSHSCVKEYHRITLVCDVCGQIFKRKASALANNLRHASLTHIFCSKTCQGHWLGKNYGIGRKK